MWKRQFVFYFFALGAFQTGGLAAGSLQNDLGWIWHAYGYILEVSWRWKRFKWIYSKIAVYSWVYVLVLNVLHKFWCMYSRILSGVYEFMCLEVIINTWYRFCMNTFQNLFVCICTFSIKSMVHFNYIELYGIYFVYLSIILCFIVYFTIYLYMHESTYT